MLFPQGQNPLPHIAAHLAANLKACYQCLGKHLRQPVHDPSPVEDSLHAQPRTLNLMTDETQAPDGAVVGLQQLPEYL
jgi:hypothetical protein